MQEQSSEKVCQREGCGHPTKALGLCRTHYHQAWRSKNPELHRANGKRWYEDNRERRQEYARQYYLEHREEILLRQKEQEARDPEAYRKRKREGAARWREENPERYRENHRRAFARSKYGLTLEEYEAILARGCAICGVKHDPEDRHGNKGPRKLCLDHNHVDGKVRDALCHHCNTGLGSFKDDPKLLDTAIKYLQKHRTEVMPNERHDAEDALAQ